MCSSTITRLEQILVGDHFERILCHRFKDHCFVVATAIFSIAHFFAWIDQCGRLQKLALVVCVCFGMYRVVLRCDLDRFARFACHGHLAAGRLNDIHIVCSIVKNILPPVVVNFVRLAVPESGFIELVVGFQCGIDSVIVFAQTITCVKIMLHIACETVIVSNVPSFQPYFPSKFLAKFIISI